MTILGSQNICINAKKAVSERGLDMTSSGIIYHESDTLKGRLLDPPDRLVAKDLLIRNTNIQGSNIFVRLRKLLEAGGFDEALVSTTDRDICIRLADLKTVRYCALAGHLVHHYAEKRPASLVNAWRRCQARRTGLFLSQASGQDV